MHVDKNVLNLIAFLELDLSAILRVYCLLSSTFMYSGKLLNVMQLQLRFS
jgi:hypothetical protein